MCACSARVLAARDGAAYNESAAALAVSLDMLSQLQHALSYGEAAPAGSAAASVVPAPPLPGGALAGLYFGSTLCSGQPASCGLAQSGALLVGPPLVSACAPSVALCVTASPRHRRRWLRRKGPRLALRRLSASRGCSWPPARPRRPRLTAARVRQQGSPTPPRRGARREWRCLLVFAFRFCGRWLRGPSQSFGA